MFVCSCEGIITPKYPNSCAYCSTGGVSGVAGPEAGGIRSNVSVVEGPIKYHRHRRFALPLVDLAVTRGPSLVDPLW